MNACMCMYNQSQHFEFRMGGLEEAKVMQYIEIGKQNYALAPPPTMLVFWGEQLYIIYNVSHQGLLGL